MRRITISTEPEMFEGKTLQARFPFQDISSALRFLRKNESKWFVKVSGEGIELDTYEAPDSATMIQYLEWVQQHQATQAQ